MSDEIEHAELVGWSLPRDAEAVPCTCNGYADRVECTAAECREFGCGRDRPGWECCARAFRCRLCGKRFVGSAEAPEMD